MNITPKMRYAYLVACAEGYYQADNIYQQPGEPRSFRTSKYKTDGKQFESILEAREISGEIGGSRILRYDRLTMQTEDVRELMRRGPERRWTDRIGGGEQ